MKNKNIIIVSVIILAILLFLYFIPLLAEFSKVELNLRGFCIGTGCHFSSATYSGGFGEVYCTGYELGFFCPSEKWKYCLYTSPLSMDKCSCEARSAYEQGTPNKFCPKNKVCYANSFEYDFGCSDNLEKTCRETEKVFTEPNACEKWWSSAFAYKFVDDPGKCSQSWSYIYVTSDNDRRMHLFDKGFILEGEASIKTICNLICQNCNSTLCTPNNICEYAITSVNTTI